MRVRPRHPAHQLTSAHLQAAYPFMGEGGLGGRGVYIGQEAYTHASFCFDPWVLYEQGTITGPSALVVGQVGRGKSALVKTYLARQAVFGRRAVVIDPKGEYGPLAEWFGSRPIRLAPGGEVRLNPLDAAGGREERVALLGALVAGSLRRDLVPEEHTALDLAYRAAALGGTPTLPAVQHHLLHPAIEAATTIAASAEMLADYGRGCALELRRLCEGDLHGMFDGPTTDGVELDAPIVVLDLSALHGSPAMAVLMVCVSAWLSSRLARDDGVKRLVVLDEGWAVLADPAAATFMQRSWKLARSYGVANMLVVHRLSDLAAAGDAGSREAKIAQGLLSDSETRIILYQSPADLEATRDLVGLTGTEIDHIATMPRGAALWKVGQRSFVVEHRLSRAEYALIDTDGRMRTNPNGFAHN
ncbi:MAG: VirB4 family type IV secretion system protein [Solirubrobacterales bacterium]